MYNDWEYMQQVISKKPAASLALTRPILSKRLPIALNL
jgi:hypothetical protein